MKFEKSFAIKGAAYRCTDLRVSRDKNIFTFVIGLRKQYANSCVINALKAIPRFVYDSKQYISLGILIDSQKG